MGPVEIRNTWWSVGLKLIIMLFPMCNTLSIFPLAAGTMGYNLYSHLSVKIKKRLGMTGPILFRIMASLLPFLFGILWPSLLRIIKINGLSSVFLQLFIPAFFEWQSKRVMKKRKKKLKEGGEESGSINMDRLMENQEDEGTEKEKKENEKKEDVSHTVYDGWWSNNIAVFVCVVFASGCFIFSLVKLF